MESQKPQQPRGAREYGQLQTVDGRSQEVVHVVTQLDLKKLELQLQGWGARVRGRGPAIAFKLRVPSFPRVPEGCFMNSGPFIELREALPPVKVETH